MPNNFKKAWIADNSIISLNRQLELLGLSKASYYYKPAPETIENLLLMELIDRTYTDCPFYGSRRITASLKNRGHKVNRKRVIRVMQLMGLEAIYPKKNLSKINQEHKKYPYLLKDVVVRFPDQVWASDITYIPVQGGFLYMTAIIDWHTRYILSWKLSNTLDVAFCLETLEEALAINKPEMFNTDQGSQYTSSEFTGMLKTSNIKISMNSKGRAFDNIFVERLWRTIKYEEVYLKRYESGQAAFQGLKNYIEFYNNQRPHQSLSYLTPYECYHKNKEVI